MAVVVRTIFMMAVIATASWLLCPASFGWTEAAGRWRRFTVKDSIEISHIVNPERPTAIVLREQPSGVPIYSPDDKYFVLVTQRGVLSSNTIEGTIWLFERQRVLKYASTPSALKPIPKKLVSLRATSNTPVIYDVRWIDGSKQIAFLGKDSSPYQRLFVADVETGLIRAVTRKESYITAYDMRGDTIAYTALAQPGHPPNFDNEMVDVGERNIFELLYRDPPAIEDISESRLLRLSSVLHVRKAGRELPISFVLDRRPLRLFLPTLSLSPDNKYLITLAPVHDVPKEWEQYQPLNFEVLRLKSGPVQEKNLMTLESLWRPEQYAIVNLETGVAVPLIGAPAGRDLGHGAPSKAFWFEDSRHAIITNTYLTLSGSMDEETRARRRMMPTATAVDVSSGAVQASIDLRETSLTAPLYYNIDDIAWDRSRQELALFYKGRGDDPGPSPETFCFKGGAWINIQHTDQRRRDQPERDINLSVREDLDHPPVLWAERSDKTSGSVLWNPNPQLENVQLGQASIYHWRDEEGRDWSGILALPPDYDVKRRYPLVIQTHGYSPDKFFADGAYTTGSGGRALVAKNIIVLQMEDFLSHASGPEEPLDNLAGFESAINHLVGAGLVDRNKVGVIGFSRTCFHVLYALTHRPDLFRAASITDGANFSYVEYTMAASRGNQYERDAEGINGEAPFGDGLMKWVRSAPNFGLEKVQAPLLISAFEREVLLSEWETYVGLRRLHKPVEFLWWWKENTPHQLVQPTQRYASQQSAVDWFDFWLGDLDGSGTTRRDYKRWRALRNLQEDKIQTGESER